MTSEPTNPKPRRRWLQYSLRTFFVLLTVACVWLGVVVHRAHEQERAVEWVRDLEEVVYYDYEIDEDGHFIVDASAPGPKWLVDLLGVDYFQDVFLIRIQHHQVNDLTPLAGFKSLKWAALSGTQVRDLTPLTKLTSLSWLGLAKTHVSDLTPLVGLKDLSSIGLKGTQVRDLTPLAKLTTLRGLDLINTPVSKEQVEKLRHALPNCNIQWSPPDPSP